MSLVMVTPSAAVIVQNGTPVTHRKNIVPEAAPDTIEDVLVVPLVMVLQLLPL